MLKILQEVEEYNSKQAKSWQTTHNVAIMTKF